MDSFGCPFLIEYSIMYTSPIRYQGSKRSLVPLIQELMPKDCPKMIDAFGGSATVVLNMPNKHRIYCESHPQVFAIVDALSSTPPDKTLSKIRRVVKKWCLTNSNETQFLAFRDHVNKKPDPLLHYILHRHSHSNLLRFNQKGEFNAPFGDRGLIGKWDQLETEIYTFYYNMQGTYRLNTRYEKLLGQVRKSLTGETFIYFDPPYLASGANCYDKWTEAYEAQLLRNLEHLTTLGVKWMLSNVTQHRHFRNDMLIKWLKKNKIRVVYPDKTYSFANAQRDSHSTIEIIAMNY